jgi:UDP-N-acetylglucosamine 2-epimerase
MYDSLLYFTKKIKSGCDLAAKAGLRRREYYLATVHRAENTDRLGNLAKIIEILESLDFPVLFPVHPRTKKSIRRLNKKLSNVRLIAPLAYREMLTAEKYARLIITDSGGVQKEAFYLNVPCVVLRGETEWAELLTSGNNMLTGLDKKRTLKAISGLTKARRRFSKAGVYGNGTAALKIAGIISKFARQAI